MGTFLPQAVDTPTADSYNPVADENHAAVNSIDRKKLTLLEVAFLTESAL